MKTQLHENTVENNRMKIKTKAATHMCLCNDQRHTIAYKIMAIYLMTTKTTVINFHNTGSGSSKHLIRTFVSILWLRPLLSVCTYFPCFFFNILWLFRVSLARTNQHARLRPFHWAFDVIVLHAYRAYMIASNFIVSLEWETLFRLFVFNFLRFPQF